MKKLIVLFVCLFVTSVVAQKRCPKDKPLLDAMRNDLCIGCDDERIVILHSKEEGVICPNREVLDFKGCGKIYSRLKKCPKERPLQTFYVGCKTCEDLGEYEILRATDNDVCPNRKTRLAPNAVLFKCIGEQPSNLLSYLPNSRRVDCYDPNIQYEEDWAEEDWEKWQQCTNREIKKGSAYIMRGGYSILKKVSK